jgi:DNA adenine methylase
MTTHSFSNVHEATQSRAKPFLKWAGGKVQLLSQFEANYPKALKEGNIDTYFEPFLGGGAVFLDIAQNYPITSAYLCDINEELILTYRVIQRNPETMVELLKQLSKQYYALTMEKRKEFYYTIRTLYNQHRYQIDYSKYSEPWITRAAHMIFLNKTCYNSLFRMNRKGEFNVPYGRYKKPKILDAENIFNVSKMLQIAEICFGDFTECEPFITTQSFVYFDPPYRPISRTSSFTSYSKNVFTDDEQIKLGNYYRLLHKKYGAKLMLSNSDPTNENPHDRFFEELYQGFKIHKVSANRMINSNAQKRGPITELVITNY